MTNGYRGRQGYRDEEGYREQYQPQPSRQPVRQRQPQQPRQRQSNRQPDRQGEQPVKINELVKHQCKTNKFLLKIALANIVMSGALIVLVLMQMFT